MSAPPPQKRRRVTGFISPIPPLSPETTIEVQQHETCAASDLLARAAHILRVEAQALSHVTTLYETHAAAREGLVEAVAAILGAHRNGFKTIVCGVGKSAYIGQKLVATMKSLSIGASFMHAAEAAHGDLGDIRSQDLVLFVTYSGKTPELLNILPHIPVGVQLMAITSHLESSTCALLADRENGILLPAPIPQSEEDSFGVCAPTTSTTVALAVSDMLALTIADELHRDKKNAVFKSNHPGDAIGISHRQSEALKKQETVISVVELPSPTISAESED